MLGKLKKISKKEAPKKKVLFKPKSAKSKVSEDDVDLPKKTTFSLHRMLTAEGWKRLTSKKT